MENKNAKSNFEKYCIAQKYEDMVRGLNLTPEQDKELRKLYSRSYLPVWPWGFVFAGVCEANAIGTFYAFIKLMETNDSRIIHWGFAVLGAEFVAFLSLFAKMSIAEKKLRNRIDEIKREYVHQISR